MKAAELKEKVIGWDTIYSNAAVNHVQFFGKVDQAEKELGINKEYAAAVVYLRTKPYWTQPLENKLVTMCKEGETVPNMLTWGK